MLPLEPEQREEGHGRRRWAIAAGAVGFSLALATFFSVKEGFFDPWFFGMVMGPAIGIALLVGFRR